jgi:hypothetical protein
MGDHHGHGPHGHDHHHHHDHGHHHHGPDHGHEHREGDGPEGTQFLDLEISQVLVHEASRLSRGVAMDIVREALRARLQERLGERLSAIGRLAADELADDVEANLEIEALIGSRKERRASLDERLGAALKQGAGSASVPAPRRPKKKAAKRRR